MKTALQHIVRHTYKPLLERYLSKTRTFRRGKIEMRIPPEVFHPGFFFSTGFLLNYLQTIPLQGRSFLELGCGSGLIAIDAAQRQSRVTATDINPIAISMLEENSKSNHTVINILHSDLFDSIPLQTFDIIAINPPYYKKQPKAPREFAWYCGENGEYFITLFANMGRYVHARSLILMVLFEGCDLDLIQSLARENGFSVQCIREGSNMLEKNFIYEFRLMS